MKAAERLLARPTQTCPVRTGLESTGLVHQHPKSLSSTTDRRHQPRRVWVSLMFASTPWLGPRSDDSVVERLMRRVAAIRRGEKVIENDPGDVSE